MDAKAFQHWSQRYRVSDKLVLRISAFWLVLALALSHFYPGFVDAIDTNITAPVQFHIRDYLGKSPSQYSKFKIFVYDDQAYAENKTGVPTVAQWGKYLGAIVARKPRAVIIDGMFSEPRNESDAEIEAALKSVRASGVPVYIGTFVNNTNKDFVGRARLDLNKPMYRPERYLNRDAASQSGDLSDLLDAMNFRTNSFAGGPDPRLAPYFTGAGHIQLIRENTLEPFVQINEKISKQGAQSVAQTRNSLIPYIGLVLAKDVHYEQGILMVDHQAVGLNRFGTIDVNFLPPRSWDKNSFLRLTSKYTKNVEKRDGSTETIDTVPGDDVEKDDVVLMLPLYFTGNTDFRTSPYGLMSGGLFIASMINSVLTGQWLKPLLANEVLVIFGVTTATLAIMFASTAMFWFLTAGYAVGVFVLSQFLFSWYGHELPWVLPAAVTLTAGWHLFIVKAIRSEFKTAALRSALDGAVAADQLTAMLRNPDSVSFEPRERVVTLMFIDVVGFSIAAENMLPRLAFDNLKTILGEMGEVVHAFGGVVDKTLGDGLLCYFGYRFDADSSSADHAEKALACGIRIQELNVERNLAAAKAGEPLYPLRIGLNTASCYLGDLGSGQRIEFTVVGNGVNFAKRLEGACETFSVMMGPTTWELVQGVIDRPKAVTRKMIRIKHHEELVDAYEYDPFVDDQGRREEVMELFRKAANLQRLNERIPVNDAGAMVVKSAFGDGFVLNFNGSGLSVQLPRAIPRENVITLNLNNRAGDLQDALIGLGLGELTCEVRWCYQAPGGYVHGLHIQNIPDDQRPIFLDTVSKYVFATNVVEQSGDLKKLQAS